MHFVYKVYVHRVYVYIYIVCRMHMVCVCCVCIRLCFLRQLTQLSQWMSSRGITMGDLNYKVIMEELSGYFGPL